MNYWEYEIRSLVNTDRACHCIIFKLSFIVYTSEGLLAKKNGRCSSGSPSKVTKEKDSSKTKETIGADPELERQIRCFPCGERSDVPRLQQVEQKAVGRQRNLGILFMQFAYIF
jgi:hypothetical protein